MDGAQARGNFLVSVAGGGGAGELSRGSWPSIREGSRLISYPMTTSSRAPEVRSISRALLASAAGRERRALVQRALPLLLLGVAIVGVPALLLSSSGLSRLERLEAEREAARLEVSRLAKRVELLQARVHAIKTDPDEVERVARDQLGLVRQTDVVFHFRK
jgi:cell division protein FtsB